ncbi:MAG TPA: hypothetical protein VF771_12545 [Longimicrobiaceae bacterium]
MRAAVSAILLVAACTAAAPARQDGSIFRTVKIGFDQPVTLGEPLRADVRVLLEPAGDHRFRVRKGLFGDAQSIVVVTRPDGAVRCMEFTYAPGFDYAASVADYRRSLGAPQSSTGASADSVQVTRWQDARTAFELTRRGTHVSSLLCDRAESP